MNASKLQDFCRSLPGATEDIKWGADLVFSVGKKMFAAFGSERGFPVGFKCSDDDFDALTEREGIIPAPYAARFGWVSVRTAKALTDAEARAFVRASYDQVLAKLPKRLREQVTSPAAAGAPAKRSGTPSRRP
jgi:predicted DNA-binding protein (MmcQ/YjbR family)